MNNIIKDAMSDLETPFDKKAVSKYFRKGKIRITMIFEDGSYTEYFMGLSENYTFTIKGKKYMIIPKCILRGKQPTITYYFNNPFPVYLEYKRSELTALDLQDDKKVAKMKEMDKVTLSNIKLDAQSINSAFTTNLIKGLYTEGGMTTKTVVIILVVVTVVILIFLQVFGIVDVFGALGIKG